jgi:hypothetical protein
MSRRHHHREVNKAIAPRAPQTDTAEPAVDPEDVDILDEGDEQTAETEGLPPVAAEPMSDIPPSQRMEMPSPPIGRLQDPAGVEVSLPNHPLAAESPAVIAQSVMAAGGPALVGPAVVATAPGGPIKCRVRLRLGAHGINILGHVQENWDPEQIGSFSPEIIASAPHCFEKLID